MSSSCRGAGSVFTCLYFAEIGYAADIEQDGAQKLALRLIPTKAEPRFFMAGPQIPWNVASRLDRLETMECS